MAALPLKKYFSLVALLMTLFGLAGCKKEGGPAGGEGRTQSLAQGLAAEERPIRSLGAARVPLKGQRAFRNTSVVPDPLIFRKYREQKEGAWTLLLPRGWIAQGGIFYVSPVKTRGYANAVAPKGNFLVKKDAAGSVMIHWLPDMYYYDARRSMVGRMGLARPGAYMNGMMIMNRLSAKRFLLRKVFPRLRPRARGLKVLQVKPLGKLARKFKAAAPRGFSYDVALLTVRYREGGRLYREQMFTVIEDLGRLGAGMWQNRLTIAARAPDRHFEAWKKVLELIYRSVKFDPKWVARVMRAVAKRTRTGMATMGRTQQIDRQIVAHRQRTNAEIQHDGYLTLTGQEDYVNPYTGKTEIRPDGWRNHWQNESGEVVVSNNPDYSPNHDSVINRTDFKRSKVRKRFSP